MAFPSQNQGVSERNLANSVCMCNVVLCIRDFSFVVLRRHQQCSGPACENRGEFCRPQHRHMHAPGPRHRDTRTGRKREWHTHTDKRDPKGLKQHL